MGTSRRSTISVPNAALLRLKRGETVRVPVNLPRKSFFGEFEFELDNPPLGISIANVSLDGGKGEIVLHSDAALCRPGLQGNLIINAFAAKTGENAGKGKEQRKKRRILLTTLPAIPFEIVAHQENAHEN